MMGDALSERNASTNTNVRIVKEGIPSADAPGCEEITAMGMEGAARFHDSTNWGG